MPVLSEEKVVKRAVQVYPRPGGPQLTVVFVVCLLFLAAIVYVGFRLLTDQLFAQGIERLIEEVQSYFR